MRSRLCSLMGKERLPVTIGTFHGIYYGILRWTYRIGQKNLLSDNEKYQILRQVIRHQKLEIFDEGISWKISLLRSERLKIRGSDRKSSFQKNARLLCSGRFTESMKSREKDGERSILMICWYFAFSFSFPDRMYWEDGRKSSVIFWLMSSRISIRSSMTWSVCWHCLKEIFCSRGRWSGNLWVSWCGFRIDAPV